MTPIGTSADVDAARAQGLGRARRRPRARRAAPPRPETNGNMMRSGPCAAARSSARSCAWNTSSQRQAEADAAQPERRPRAVDRRMLERRAASSLTSNVRIVTRPGAIALDQPRVGGVLRLFVSAAVPPPASRNSDRNSPMPFGARARAPAPRRRATRRWPRAGSATPSSVTAGRSRYSSSDCSYGAPLAAGVLDAAPSVSGVRIDEHVAARAVDGEQRARRDQRCSRCAGRRPPGRESSAPGWRCDRSSCRRR